MYVSYLLDKDGPMYPSPVRHSGGLNLAAQNFVGAPQYADYGGYHVNLDSAQSPGPAWPAPYGSPKRRFGVCPDPAGAATGAGLGWGETPPGSERPPPGAPEGCSGEGRNAVNPFGFGFAFLTLPFFSAVKTRTKDKYRVVYTDHQRLELEKEFHYSRYITIRRKAELASNLGLSERQVKIWFQNRRAKERKINKKKLQQAQPGGALLPELLCVAVIRLSINPVWIVEQSARFVCLVVRGSKVGIVPLQTSTSFFSLRKSWL
uniref:Caudal type homeobox 2 n=1 Tax=Apteryx owenii TaxID=8824 RepID=A0A8B9PYE1_APTOW